jgi:hypothetical protein
MNVSWRCCKEGKQTHRIEPVKPVPPKDDNLVVRNNDAAKVDQTRPNDNRVCERSKQFIGRVSCNCLTDSCIKEFVDCVYESD